MRIEIVDHRSEWADEFAATARPLRDALGGRARAIHHIGSTAVPGLAAKDVVDVQVTVSELGESVLGPLVGDGFRLHPSIDSDHLPPGLQVPADGLRKRIFKEREGARRANIHVRVEGAFNQRYAVLFRDYLRRHPAARDAYDRLKRNLAGLFPESAEHYYHVKDPAIDMLMAGAEVWATSVGWTLPPTDA